MSSRTRRCPSSMTHTRKSTSSPHNIFFVSYYNSYRMLSCHIITYDFVRPSPRYNALRCIKFIKLYHIPYTHYERDTDYECHRGIRFGCCTGLTYAWIYIRFEIDVALFPREKKNLNSFWRSAAGNMLHAMYIIRNVYISTAHVAIQSNVLPIFPFLLATAFDGVAVYANVSANFNTQERLHKSPPIRATVL